MFKNLLVALAATLGLHALGSVAAAQAHPGDERIIAAREALRTGDRNRLEQLAARSDPSHPLDHYVRYWLLVNILHRPAQPPHEEIADYIARHENSVAGHRLREYWLKRLSEDNDGHGFLRVFAEHENPSAELRCLAWRARHQIGDPTVFEDVSSQWTTLVDSHEACEPLFQAGAAAGRISEDLLWWRFQRQIDSRSPERAKITAGWLSAAQRPRSGDIDQVTGSPAQYLDRLPPNSAVPRPGRELALAALTRLARQDALAAHVRLIRINDRLSHEERAYAHTVLGHHGALSRLPQADDWYRAAGDAAMTPAQRAWRVRAALRNENWRQVAHAIEALDDDERQLPEWQYWYARARAEAGHADEARAIFVRLAGQTDFYGLLAAERLGNLFLPPPADSPVRAEDRARVLADPGVAAALAFYRIGLNVEAVREWFRAVRGRDQAFLLAAAQLALEHDLYDRAINTAELADPNANFRIRFIAPYRDRIEPQVREQGLDLAWVYGIMRQESRFIVPARSSAGAQGLMQVMPATGKWVAERIGLRGYQQRMLNDPDTNVLLGTSYMRIILGELDNHPVLASAGYNAGPGRARRWRDQRPIEAAIYIETIPFDETRDYVKKVLANAVVYAALFENRPQSLKQWLSPISPAPGG